MLSFLKTHSYKDKRLLLGHLEGRGHKKPKGWKKIHSEVCHSDELEFSIPGLLKELAKKHGYSLDNKDKFAIDIISNPNLESRFDKGEFKVRYRYDLAFDKKGQAKIKDNTREFCAALINENKLFRREDIDSMSFAGANPLASQNYSIFKLKGHWNCRHAWRREVYVQIKDENNVENNPTLAKNTILTNHEINIEVMELNENVKKAIASFHKQLGTEQLSKDDIVEINKVLFGQQKFVDAKVDDKILRVDAETIEKGAAVNWIDDAGELMDVEDGEITLADEGKVITVAEGVIAEVVDVIDEAAEEEAEETELNETPTVEEQFEAFKAETEKNIANAIEEGLKGVVEKLTGKFAAIEKKIDDMPAFEKEDVKSEFNENKPEKKKRVGLNTPMRRPEKN